MSCWTSTCLPVQLRCTSTCCVTRIARQTNVIRAKRPLQRSCTFRATPSQSTFVFWRNVVLSSRNTQRSSRGAASRETAACFTRSSQCPRSWSVTTNSSSQRWTAQRSVVVYKQSCQHGRVRESGGHFASALRRIDDKSRSSSVQCRIQQRSSAALRGRGASERRRARRASPFRRGSAFSPHALLPHA